MINWIHHLLNPHCPECREERNEAKECKSCDSLRHQLELSLGENHRLVTVIAQMSQPVAEPKAVLSPEYKPINTNTIPWRVRQQQLEAEDRKTAALLRDKQREAAALRSESGGLKANIPDVDNSIENLEKELGVQ